MCFYRLQLSHHYPTSTWRSASETQQGFAQTGGIRHPQGVVPVGSAPSAMFQKRREKNERKKRDVLTGGRDKKGFSSLSTCVSLRRPSLPNPKAPPPPSLPPCMPALLFKISTQMTGMWFVFSFFFFFFNASLQMNAYTAALSVALPNCCVLTSSRDIHYNNGSLAWMKAKQNASLH